MANKADDSGSVTEQLLKGRINRNVGIERQTCPQLRTNHGCRITRMGEDTGDEVEGVGRGLHCARGMPFLA
jgi:hypothetical protein